MPVGAGFQTECARVEALMKKSALDDVSFGWRAAALHDRHHSVVRTEAGHWGGTGEVVEAYAFVSILSAGKHWQIRTV